MRVKFSTPPGISVEKSNVSMLLTQSFFLGIFFGTFNIVAWTLLLSTFDGKILAPAFLVSALAGIIFILLYRKVRSGFRFKNFTFFSLAFCTFLTLLFCSSLYVSSWKWIPFIIFSFTVPLSLIVFNSYLENRAHSGGKGKLTDRRIIAGITLTSLSIPLLLYLKFPLPGIIMISPISLFVASVLQIFLQLQIDFQKPADKAVGSDYFAKGNPIRIIALFAGIGLMIVLMIQYLLLVVARMQFLVDTEMAGLLGFFTAGLMLLTMTGKYVIFPFLLKNYGLRAAFIIPPILTAIVIFIVIILRLALGINAVTLPGFFVFFALGGLFSFMLVLSVNFPSLRVIFNSVETNFRDIFLKGTTWVILSALLSSGIILTITGIFFSGIIYFLILLIPLIGVWIYIAFQMHDLYRKRIFRLTDSEETRTLPDNGNQFLKNRFAGQLLFKTNYYRLISGDYSVLDEVKNKWYFEEIIDNAWSKKDLNLLPVLKRISMIDVLDEGIRKKSSEVLSILQKKTVFFKYDDEKIAEAVKILSGNRIPQTTQILSLLRDKSNESKKLAVYMIGKFGLTDLLSVVCDCLNNPGTAREAYGVLKSFGRDAGNELMRSYLISSGNSKLSKTIIQLLQEVRTSEAISFLFSRLGSYSRQLRELILNYLLEINFIPSTEEKKRLDQLASDTIGILTWDLSAMMSLGNKEDSFLWDKINRETERWQTFLFNILMIIYGKGPVNRILQSMTDRSLEGASVTNEIIDFYITGPVKHRLLSYFEVSEKRRLQKLFLFYPGEIVSHDKLLEDIINRDYNLIGLWTKASALRSFRKIEGDELVQSVTALLFSQEEIIQEETANLIARTKPEFYYSASPRLADATRYRLDKILSGSIDPRQFLYEKVQFLANILQDIPEDELLPLASEMSYLKYFDNNIINSSDGCIIWSLGEAGSEPHIFYKGETDIIGRKLRNKESFYILTLLAIEEYHFRFPEQSGGILEYVDQKQS